MSVQEDPTQSHTERWTAGSPFISKPAEEQQTPLVHQSYQLHTPFREEQELEEMYGAEAEEEDMSTELEDEEPDGVVYELIDEASELYPEHYSVELQEESPQQVINSLIDKGLSENDITNEIFYRRNPKLRGQVLRAGTSQARQWRAIRDREVRPAAKRLLSPSINDPELLATFFSQYEGDNRVPAKATERFLLRSPLLSMGRTLRDRVLWEWRSGKSPVTLNRLYELAYDVSVRAGSAMLLCHNVTKAFARGGAAITWDRVPTAPETYSDGKKIWIPRIIHPDGKLLKIPSERYKRELLSIYYLLFSAKELGTNDPGDWYHYYVAATMTAFGAAGELSPSAPVRELEDREDDNRTFGPIVGSVIDKAYPLLVRDRVLDLESQMSNPDLVGMPGYRGWVLANVVSFLEGGYYGEKQEDVARESRFHRRGALAGLHVAGTTPGRDWVWYVPGAKGLSEQDLAYGFQLQFKAAEVLGASGQPFGRPKKGAIKEMYGPEVEEGEHSTELVGEEPEEEAYELIDDASELDLYQEPLAEEGDHPLTQPAKTGHLLQEHFESLVEEAKALLDEMVSDFRRYDVATMSEVEIEAFLDQYQLVGTQRPQRFDYLPDDVRDMAKRHFEGVVDATELQTRQAEFQPASPFRIAFEDYVAGEHAQLGETQVELRIAFAPSSYTVRKGDTLSAIAKRFGITVAALKDANKSKLRRWPARDGSGRIVEGFEARETVLIPQRLNDFVEAATRDKSITFTVNGVVLEYGVGIAMGGDLFESPEQMANASPKELKELATLIKREQAGGKVTTEEWQRATGARYLDLAKRNEAHFAPPNPELVTPSAAGSTSANHKSAWEWHHRAALDLSKSGDKDKALMTNAFADHFLTDAFAAGHLVNKRDVMERFKSQLKLDANGKEFTKASKRFFDDVARNAFTGVVKTEFSKYETYNPYDAWWNLPRWNPNINDVSRFSRLLQGIHKEEPDLLANAVAKGLHDNLNTLRGGLPVENVYGDAWALSGDGTLNARTTEIAHKAVAQSQFNVISVFKSSASLDYPTLHKKVWDYTPKPGVVGTKQLVAVVQKGTDINSADLKKAVVDLIKANYKLLIHELVRRRILKEA